MSDLPQFTDPKDAEEFAHALGRHAGIAATTVLPAWMTQVSPYRVDDQGQRHWQLPGGALAFYGAAGQAIPMAYNFGMGKLGLSNRIPAFPGAEEASRQYAETKESMLRAVPHVAPETPDEQMTQDLAFATAGMAVPGANYVTGPMAKILTSLPRVPKIAGALPGMAVPHASMGNALGGAGMGAGAETLVEKEKDDAIRAMGGDPVELRAGLSTPQVQNPSPQANVPMQTITVTPQGTVPTTGADQWDLSAPDQSHQVVNPRSGAAAQIPFPTSSTTNPYTISLKDLQAAPQYGSTGETNTSWPEFLAELGGAGAITWLGLKHGGKLLDPAYKALTGQWSQLNTAANIAAHNANLDAIDAGHITAAAGAPQASGAARGEAPLPGKAGTVGTQMAQALWDKTRIQTELVKATGDRTPASKLATEQLVADLGNTNGSAALPIKIGEQMATGVNDATGHQLPVLKEWVQRYDQLTPDRQKVFDVGAHAAAELDIRDANTTRLTKGGKPFTDEDTRQNFTSAHTTTLQANKAAMLADPETKAVHDAMLRIMPTSLDEAVYTGRITAAEAASFKATRPNFVPPTDANGHITGDLYTPHARTTSWETPNAPVVDSVVNHYMKFYGDLTHNTVNDKVMRQLETYLTANPNASRMITKVDKPTTEGRPLTVYREGIPHTFQIEHTGLYNSFKSNAAQTNVWMNGLDAFRNSMQSGTTGVSGTLIGQRPFAVIQAMRSIPQIAMDRTPGTSFGMIDKALQRATGGKVGSRLGIDPTQYTATAYHAVAGSAAVTARNMSDILRNPANPASKMMRALKGDPWVENAAVRLEQKYRGSDIAKMRRMGATGGGTGGVYEERAFNRDPRSTTGFNPLADTVPGVFHPDGLHIPFTKVALPGTRGVVSTYINIRTLLRDVHSAVADAGNAAYFAQNPHLSDAVRAFETRRVIGDPSASGASKTARFLGQATPYLNPSIQDIVRATRNFRDHPGAFVAGTVGTLVIANAASLLTAMLGGQKHLDVLEKHMTSHERASNIPFFHNMQNAQDYTEINLGQRLRMINPAIQELLALGSGAYMTRQGEPEYDRIIHSLADVFSHHVSMGTASGMVSGAGDFFDVMQPPQAVHVLANVAGKNINPIASTLAQNLLEGKRPLSSGMVTDIGSPTKIPGRQQNAFISKDDNGWMQRLMSNIMGVAGHGLHDAISSGWDNYKAAPDALHGVSSALDGMVGTAGQSWRDNAPFGAAVWGNNIKMSYRNPLEENFMATFDKMRTMTKAADTYAQGFTRPGGLPIAQGETPSINPDPTIQQMMTVVNNYHANIMTNDMPNINDLRAQLTDIDNNTIYDKSMQREIHNAQVGKLNAAYEVADEKIRELNAWLSHIAGKTVHVRSFDPSKGMEQFHD